MTAKRVKLDRILVCPNAFKGSLSATEAAEAISQGIGRVSASASTLIDCLPLSDGGDGFLETLVAATDGTLHESPARDPFGEARVARWGRLGGEHRQTGVIEMALASGLSLLEPAQYDPLRASTLGTGDLMRAAISSGCKRLILGIGGSATNDGGAGAMQALGAKLRDANGTELPPGGSALSRLETIDMTDFTLPPGFEILVACDVANVLTGESGASAVYGPQKGATPAMVAELDAALRHYADVLIATLDADVANTPGAGAAGGLGAGLMAFSGAKLMSGIEIVFEATRFDERLAKAQLVFTGEGQLDFQTVNGKALSGVARRAKALRIPVIAIAGAIDPEAEAALRDMGLTAAISLCERPMSLEEAKAEAPALLANAAERAFRLLATPIRY